VGEFLLFAKSKADFYKKALLFPKE